MTDEIKQLKDLERELALADGGAELKSDHYEDSACTSGRFPGILLIGIGLYFLASTLTGFSILNWWALFILVPGLCMLAGFVHSIGRKGGGEAAGKLMGGLVMVFVGSVFLFGLSWGLVWPGFLIIAGLGALVSALFTR